MPRRFPLLFLTAGLITLLLPRAAAAPSSPEQLLLSQARGRLQAGQPADALRLLNALAAIAPQYAQGRFLRAQALAELGRLPPAADEVQAALALAPGMTDAHRLAAHVWLGTKRPTRALLAIQQALADDDTHGPSWLLRAEILLRLGLPSEASRSCIRAKHFGADPVRRAAAWTRAMDRLNRPAPAMSSLITWLKADPRNLDALRMKAVLMARLKNVRGSNQVLSQIVQRDRRSLESVLTLARVASLQGHTSQASRAIRIGFRSDKHKTDARLYAARGQLYLRDKKRDKAIDDVRTALMLNPQSPEAISLARASFRQARDYSGLLKLLDVCLREAPQNPLLLLTRSDTFLRLGQDDKAERDANALLGVLPDFVDGLQLRLEVASRRRQPKAVLKLVDRLRAKGVRRTRITELQARALGRLGRPHDALLMCREALSQAPNTPSLYLSSGYALLDLGRFEQAAHAFGQAIRIGSRSAGTYGLLGFAYMRLGRYPDALEPLRAAVRLAPKDARYQRQLATLYYELQRYHEAIEAATRAAQLEPKKAWPHAMQSSPRIMLYDVAGALASLDDALRLAPKDGRVHRQRGVVLGFLDRWEEAARAHRQDLELRAKDARAWSSWATHHLDTGQLEDALRHATKAAELGPDDRRVQRVLANCMLSLGRGEEALHIAEAFSAAHPDDVPAWTWKASVSLDLHRYGDALEAANRAVALRPLAPEPYEARIDVWLAKRRYPEALADCERLRSLRPESFEPLLKQARILALAGDVDGAMAACERASGLRAPDVAVSAELMSILAGAGRYDDALRESERFMADPNGLPGRKYAHRAAIRFRAGRFQDALQDAGIATKRQPGRAGAWRVKAQILTALARFPDALVAAERTLYLAPLDPASHRVRAWALHRLGRSADALDALARAVQLAPDDDMAHIRLGMVWADMGQVQRARQYLKQAERLVTKDHWTRARLAELRARILPTTTTQPGPATSPSPSPSPSTGPTTRRSGGRQAGSGARARQAGRPLDLPAA